MEQEQTTRLSFERGQANADELQSVIEEVIAELDDTDSESAQLAQRAGIDPTSLASARVSVTEEAGIEPVTTTIVVGLIVSVGGHIVGKFWDDVVWPRIVRRLGGLAIGSKRS